MNDRRLIPYAVILSAKSGDPIAMKTILAHYDGLINFHSRCTLFDEYGTPHTVVDAEIKERICVKIMDRIIYDFDPHRLPNGEILEE